MADATMVVEIVFHLVMYVSHGTIRGKKLFLQRSLLSLYYLMSTIWILGVF